MATSCRAANSQSSGTNSCLLYTSVRCDSREDLNIPPFGGQIDFLTYGGIYRAVSLDVKEPAYLRDIFIEAQAEGDFRIYSSTVGETVGCTLQAEIRSPSGSRALYQGELSLPIVGTLNGVHPWSLEHPSLYTLTAVSYTHLDVYKRQTART